VTGNVGFTRPSRRMEAKDATSDWTVTREVRPCMGIRHVL
jgi:hypothetical protein